MIDLRGVVVVDGGGCVKQHRQQVLLHVANFRGIFLQTVHDKLDMGAVQLQKPGTHDLVREVAASDPGGFSLGTDGLHHQLHNFIQIIPIGSILLLDAVILDVL